jgi:hypothetical protein
MSHTINAFKGDTMKKAIADLWIKALKSGKYKQGKYVLHTDDNKFCCLGVLCDVYNKEQKKSKKKTLKVSNDDNDDGLKCFKYNNECSYLPKAVRDWAGIQSDRGYLEIEEDYTDSLAGLNDGDIDTKGKTFKQIANIISKYYKTL